MTTTLLYHRDPLLLAFDGVVREHASSNGRPSVVLDETAFYPEAGGQMADRGTLAGAPVVDVQIDDAGRVHHVVDAQSGGAQPAVGARVRGVVDRVRRRQFMALHTAQHMLSRALIDEAGAETVSARLGESVCTVDVDVQALADAPVAKAEALVNALVDDDVAVRAFFPSDAELKALPLRRQPKVSENIRVVAVGAPDALFDVSPCGGTHCTSTAQVGLLRVTGLERYKGIMRVSFQAGPRARVEVFESTRVLEGMARELSAGAADVPAALEKLRAQLKGARDERAGVVAALARLLAADLVKHAAGAPVVHVLELATLAGAGGGVDLLRALGESIARDHDGAALLACPTPEGVQVLCIRGTSSTLDCGAVLKRAAAACGGRGGGRPERAEGRLPVGVDWRALVAGALAPA